MTLDSYIDILGMTLLLFFIWNTGKCLKLWAIEKKKIISWIRSDRKLFLCTAFIRQIGNVFRDLINLKNVPSTYYSFFTPFIICYWLALFLYIVQIMKFFMLNKSYIFSHKIIQSELCRLIFILELIWKYQCDRNPV